MTHDEVEKSWKNGKALPVYVFHGEEEFLRSELLHSAPGLLVPEEGTRSFNYDLFYGAETSMRDVISIAQSFPMMADKRLVIVRESERILRAKPEGAAQKKKSKAKAEDPLLRYLEQPNHDTVLIFDMVKMGARNTSPFKELSERAAVIEFPVLKEAGVVSWLQARSKKMGKALGESAARLMVAHLGTSLRTHANELEKLATYSGDASIITDDDVEQVVGVSREYNVFELTKSIGLGNGRLATEIVLHMLDQDKNARQLILVMLSRYIEQLIVARELAAKGESEKAIADALELRGGAAFFAKEFVSAARKYSRDGLDHAMRSIVEAEERTRKIPVDNALMFQELILNLLPRSAQA